ncbi:hypothetical protein BLA60_30935 [Actinophytocola xinjiangensis]|uniref:Amino acid/amide ABC transporter membrane protein 1 (HAAT family) n=1 Tax=Actinophytocola xinjiangensis TaxID=485602 RepID=A0A7Z0WJL8_9PSEU|nr:branched-chain amino acid ABC transporter permease [Actinophytocola xinjiangensis]OLF06679.1 hypothetical protein BLA60_30935 [Actinophytocola xinjiangensis]
MTIVWSGLAVGAVYALVAIGYNLPLSQSGVFNFAHGQFVVLGNFLAWFAMVELGLPWWSAALAGAAFCALLGFAEEAVAIRPVIGKHGGHGALVTTVGASVIIQGVLLATWAQTPKSVTFFGGGDAFTLLGGRLEPVDLWLLGLAVVTALSLHLVSRRTSWGIAGRAANDDPDAAKAKGINVTALRATAFALAGGLAGLLGPVTAAKIGVDVGSGITLTVFGFVALALGGFGSYTGCLVGGLFVGLVQAVTNRYLGVEFAALILFAVLLAVLVFKPTGLLGRRALRVV